MRLRFSPERADVCLLEDRLGLERSISRKLHRQDQVLLLDMAPARCEALLQTGDEAVVVAGKLGDRQPGIRGRRHALALSRRSAKAE